MSTINAHSSPDKPFADREAFQIPAGGFEVKAFLRHALRIVSAVPGKHRNSGLDDARLCSIRVNDTTGEVTISGLGQAFSFTNMARASRGPATVADALVYFSPERTGRMDGAADLRSDLYSLGVVFHEMLAGSPPFQSDDALELVYSHLTLQPAPLSGPGNAIPQALSDIVMKLLAKALEDRYQTAAGLELDLRECLEQLEATGWIRPFTPGLKDVADVLRIPQKLYGRTQELAALMGSFNRVSRGAKELLLVSGYSGIGKSALVHEVRLPILKQRGYFISGKFDQYKLNIPYSALTEAFRELVQQVIGESDASLQNWKDRILEALGPNVAVLAAVVPEITLITGAQPPAPELPAQEAENRFQLTFGNFVRVVTSKAQPLVIFIDDLQWVDHASLKLMRMLMTDPALEHLLVIGAYRDNEVKPTHLLMFTLDEIRKSGAIINNISLPPLGDQAVGNLVADTLRTTRDEAAPLSELIMSKTGGNPFFVRQFLQTLYDERLVVFEPGEGIWRWDLASIYNKGITDNVVDLMASRMLKLSFEAVDTLKHAACIGNTFSLETLAVVLEKTPNEAAAVLEEVLRAGPISADRTQPRVFRFQHDRIQQAAYSLIPDDEKKAIHLKIGRLLLQKGAAVEQLFEIVNHLNCALDLVQNEEEKIRLAKLNLEAGRKAKKETAYASALRYFTAGTDLLPEDCWQASYELAYALHVERAEIEFLNTYFENSERRFDLVLKRTRTKLEKVRVYTLKVVLYENMSRPTDAVRCGFEGLALLGFNLRLLPVPVMLLINLAEVKWRLRNLRPERLSDLPVMSDKETKAAMNLLMQLIPSAYFISKFLVTLLTVKMTSLSLKHGITEGSSFAFVSYGVVEGSVLGNIQAGYELAEAALRLCERLDERVLFSKIGHIFGGYSNHWRRPVRTDIPFLEASYKSGLEFGDITYASYSTNHIAMYSFQYGASLDTVLADARKYAGFCARSKIKHQLDNHIVLCQVILNLKGLTNGNASFSDKMYDEDSHVLGLRSQSVKVPLYGYCTIKALSSYIFGDYASALSIAAEAEKGIFELMLGMLTVVECSHFLALSAAALYPTAHFRQKLRYAAILRRNRRRMKKWADNCPENFLHKLLLIDAESRRIKHRDPEAERLYELAIQSAHENGFIQHEAIANECAARFHLERGRAGRAGEYLAEARSCYATWGADGKVKALEDQYPAILKRKPSAPAATAVFPDRNNILDLDMAAVLRASQSLAESFDLDTLLKNLMKIMLQHAGAQKGLLFMEISGRLQQVAEGLEDRQTISIRGGGPLGEAADYPAALVKYVARTREYVILGDATREDKFSADLYFKENRPRSVMCIPLFHHGKRASVLYLENRVTPHVFNAGRLALLNMLSAQLAVSLENALLQREKEETLRIVHDSLSADMYNIFLLSTMSDKTADSAELSRLLSSVSETSGSGLQTIRDFLFLSSKESLPITEFKDMLADYGNKLFENGNTEFTLDHALPEAQCALSPVVVFNLYMAYKEALTNVLKHAKAHKVSVALVWTDGNLTLSVRDDGAGFAPAAEGQGGNGVNNMRIRAGEIGATCALASLPGQGTELRMELPLECY